MLFVCTLVGCSPPNDGGDERVTQAMNEIAEAYVKLVLAVGQHDNDYVDAYYGPERWRTEVEAENLALPAIEEEADRLLAELRPVQPTGTDTVLQLRHQYLTKQLQSVRARVQMLKGANFPFDRESEVLYDAVAPSHPDSHFAAIAARLEEVLPGRGALSERFAAFRKPFVVPAERLDTVFKAAITECRNRTRGYIQLPAEEHFMVEYVTDKSWSGYNWYQGSYQSLIQVNIDLPIFIDRAIDLACHEGYPGHHAYNVLLEHHLVNGRGWVEYSVYPLFSPQSLIAEGSANYGIEMAFGDDERTAFERDVLYPLAGLDPSRAAEYNRVRALVDDLGYAGNEAARRYLNGEIDGDAAARWLAQYALMDVQRARQRVRFFDQYRSYVINYNLGQDLVRDYVRRGEPVSRALMWNRFGGLLTTPRLPSGLR